MKKSSIADKLMTERDLEYFVRDVAKTFGWHYHHTWLSIHSSAGYPDDTMIKDGRLIIAELKSEKGQPTPEQYFWLEELAEVPGIEVFLWRPSDRDEIIETLSGLTIRPKGEE